MVIISCELFLNIMACALHACKLSFLLAGNMYPYCAGIYLLYHCLLFQDGTSGDEFNKDSVERDERRLTELGRRTIEIFVLAQIFR